MTGFLHRKRVVGLMLLAACCSHMNLKAARCEEGGTKPNPDGAKFPELPTMKLARSRAVEGEGDPAEHWAARVRESMDAASKAQAPLEKSRFLLDAANTILARQLEPYSSHAVLKLDAGYLEGEQDAIRSHFDQAEKLLKEARDLLAAVPLAAEEVEAGEDAQAEGGHAAKPNDSPLLQAADTLQSFLNGQRAFLLGEIAPGSRRRAASALAPLLEDPNKQVAAAARLWQALLRGLEPDPSAALQILDSPMALPHPETWPYGLFSRVLRCRYQGVQGAWSSALVMLAHIEEQLEPWVPEIAHRGDARRFFAYTRLDVLKRWYDSLPPEREAERAWCASQAEEFLKVYFSVETSLLRLDPAIPIVVPAEMKQLDEKKAEPQ